MVNKWILWIYWEIIFEIFTWMTNIYRILIEKREINVFTFNTSYTIHVSLHSPFNYVLVKRNISLNIILWINTFYFLKNITNFIKIQKIALLTNITFIRWLSCITMINLILNAFGFIKNSLIVIIYIPFLTLTANILKYIYSLFRAVLDFNTLINNIRVSLIKYRIKWRKTRNTKYWCTIKLRIR